MKKLPIIHVIINKYIIDDKIYNFRPNDINLKKIVLEIELICLDKSLVNKINSLFNECKIDVRKIISYDYSKRFLKNNSDETSLSAYKILNNINQSEVYLDNNIKKKQGI